MVLTPSTMVELGTAAPSFSLKDVVSQRTVSLESFADSQGLLVMFICNHCPYVKHVQHELAALGRDYQDASLGIVAISSNDVTTRPEDGPEHMAEVARTVEYVFPYLFDETQEVAKAYGAVCTPDFFLFDRDRRLVYRGQLDDSRPGNGKPVTGADLRRAIDALLAGEGPVADQKPSIGCNIKWKA